MATTTPTYKGIIPPLCTPLTETFEIDVPSLRRLITFVLDSGVHGVFVLGSTGEAAFLTDAQREQVIVEAARVIAGRVPLFAGIFDMTTTRVLAHAATAQRAGADVLVLTAPFYMRTGPAEILEHFRLVAQQVNHPLFAYDIPLAVHTKLERATLAQLAREGLIVGIKDSSGDEPNFRALLGDHAQTPGFSIFTGSELLVDTALLLGAHGAVPGLANVDPHGYVRLYQAAHAHDWEHARREQERLFRLYRIASVGFPTRLGPGSAAMGGFKTALMLRGIIATNVVGRPMLRLNPEEVEQVRITLAAAGLLKGLALESLE